MKETAEKQGNATDWPLQHQVHDTFLNVYRHSLRVVSAPMNLLSVIKELHACLTLLVCISALLRGKNWFYLFVPTLQHQAQHLVITEMLTLTEHL